MAMDLATMTGLEQLQALFAMGDASPVGIAHLLGMRVELLEHGKTVFSLEPRPEFGNPQGTVHGGVLSTLLDSAMTCAVHAALPVGAACTTLELKVNFVRPVPLRGGLLTCAGTVVHQGRKVATTEGRIVDANGKLIAHGTSTCMILSLEA
jgi:uncharacterized protein (TIGR00369 family)